MDEDDLILRRSVPPKRTKHDGLALACVARWAKWTRSEKVGFWERCHWWKWKSHKTGAGSYVGFHV